MVISGTPRHTQELILGLLLKGVVLERTLGVQDAVKPLIIAEGSVLFACANLSFIVDFG
jgi:hypothetical protein